MKSIFYFYPIAGLLMLSCQSLRRIDMINKSNAPVEFIWNLNEDSLKDNPFFISSSKTLSFVLNPEKNKAVKMSFGPGNWSPTEVQKLVNFLESVHIVTQNKTIRIDSLPLLKEYLLARRRGVGGARIELVVDK